MAVAVVGTGSAGLQHLQALKALDGVRPIAVPIRAARAQELARAGHHAAADLPEAIRMGARFCIVATDPGRHLDDALAAMAEGMDVLIEKPLAVDAGRARRVVEHARAIGRQAFVGCVLRFSDSLVTFRQWLPSVGRLHMIRVVCQSSLPSWRPARPYRESYSAHADEGGVLRDMIHDIDAAGWLFGWPANVAAMIRNLGRLGIASEELAHLLWETKEGAVVSLTLDYLSRPATRGITAYGERGTVEWNGIAGTVTLACDGAPVREARSAQMREEMFIAQARAFIDARRGALDPRLATADEGMRALAVCDAARAASRARAEVPVIYP